MQVDIKEAKSRLGFLISQVEAGNEVIILRHSKEVARLVPPRVQGKPLPNLKDFRSTIEIKGKPLSIEVIEARQEERY